ncbi:hypothetical protein Golomagni_06728 [Golovinomyces magnicellulatus]|nr:hypothetical protein Golomagni_06728 [Golovinomyces magnicellulatus]
MSKSDNDSDRSVNVEDDEPDEWDVRINNTGCSVENKDMNDCYFEKKDWRLCKAELEAFKECWKNHNNDKRTSTKDS